MRSSFRESSATTGDGAGDRRTVICERLNGSFGFTLQVFSITFRQDKSFVSNFKLFFFNANPFRWSIVQSYGIHYREESDVEIVTYVDFVDPKGHAHKAGLRSGTTKTSSHAKTKPSEFVFICGYTTFFMILTSGYDRFGHELEIQCHFFPIRVVVVAID